MKKKSAKKISKVKKPKIWTTEKADVEFSKWIRERDSKCLRCGKERSPENPLTCSHFWVRQHSSTRYDPENCISLCWMPCHKYHWEKEKQGAYRDFMIGWLGEEKYAGLEERSRTIKNRTDSIIECMKLLNIL